MLDRIANVTVSHPKGACMVSLAKKPKTFKIVGRNVPHKFNPVLFVTVYTDGTIDLRESRSRDEPVSLDLYSMYVTARVHAAMKMPTKRKGRR
jgi:hypothetical protein